MESEQKTKGHETVPRADGTGEAKGKSLYVSGRLLDLAKKSCHK